MLDVSRADNSLVRRATDFFSPQSTLSAEKIAKKMSNKEADAIKFLDDILRTKTFTATYKAILPTE